MEPIFQYKDPRKILRTFLVIKVLFSISVQAVCDYRGIFMNTDCSWPGFLHDAKRFTNSNINSRMAETILPITYQNTKTLNFLIEDPAYPLT